MLVSGSEEAAPVLGCPPLVIWLALGGGDAAGFSSRGLAAQPSPHLREPLLVPQRANDEGQEAALLEPAHGELGTQGQEVLDLVEIQGVHPQGGDKGCSREHRGLAGWVTAPQAYPAALPAGMQGTQG